MNYLERVDKEIEVPGGKVVYTKKVMENGEIRERVTFPDLSTTTKTTATDWPVNCDRPWQAMHFHKGRTEVYILEQGQAFFVVCSPDTRNFVLEVLTGAGSTISFVPGTEHLVLLAPEAIIRTDVFGVPVCNPDKNGQYWWASETRLVERALKFGNHHVSSQYP